MRVKLASTLCFAIVFLTIVFALKLGFLGATDQSRYLLDSMQSETGLLRASTQILNQSLSEQLVQMVALEESIRLNPTPGVTNAPFLRSDFLMISLLESDGTQGWRLRWSKQKSGVKTGWGVGRDSSLIQSLPLASVIDDQIIWHRGQSESGLPVYHLIIEVRTPSQQQPMLALGVMSNQAFARVIENFKSTTREVMILDERGHALGYTQQQYVGATMEAHPLVQQMLRERKSAEVTEIQDRNGLDIVGAYQRLDRSNLYVLVTQQSGVFSGLFAAQLMSLSGFAVAALLLSLALGFYLLKSAMASSEYLQDLVLALAQGLPLKMPTPEADLSPLHVQAIQKLQQSGPEIRPAPVTREMSETAAGTVTQAKTSSTSQEQIYKQVANGITASLRDPIHVILGQAQLARTKAEGHPAEDHFAAIEREARRVRGILEQLQKVAGRDSDQMERADLQDIVLSALKEVKPQMDSLGVKLHKDLIPLGQVMVDVKKMKTALIEVFKNAIESMVDSEKKELFVVARENGTLVDLTIQDTGSGISSQDLAKVFNPFFTTKSESGQKGLGLSVAKSVVESCSGKIKIDSTGKEGTRLVIELPMTAAVAHREDRLPKVLPEIAQPELGGIKPIVGTDADRLPSTPTTEEEIEMSLLKMGELGERDSDLDLIASDTDEDEVGAPVALQAANVEPPVAQSTSTVLIRKPKVGSDE